MSDRDPASYTAQDLANPEIDPATLGQIAGVRQDLWPAILAHPNCYPELARFIQDNTPSAPQGAPYTQSTPQGAPYAQNLPAQNGPENGAFGGQAYGSPQSPAGAQPYYGAQGSAVNGQNPAVNGQNNGAFPYRAQPFGTPSASGLLTAKSWPQIAQAVLGIIGLISLFLPIVKVSVFGQSQSVNFFSSQVKGTSDGPILLVAMVLVAGSAIAAIITKQKQAGRSASGLGITGGLAGVVIGILNWSNISDTNNTVGGGVSAGIGLIILVVVSIAIIVVAALSALPKFSGNAH